MVSLLKLEKVLKPPQNPTTINNRAVVTRSGDLGIAHPEKVPSMMQARILAVKVPNGNIDGQVENARAIP